MKAIQPTLITLTLAAGLFLCGHVYQNTSFANNDQTNFDALKQNIEKPSDRVDFENDLIPIFTKFGCNAGHVMVQPLVEASSSCRYLVEIRNQTMRRLSDNLLDGVSI